MGVFSLIKFVFWFILIMIGAWLFVVIGALVFLIYLIMILIVGTISIFYFYFKNRKLFKKRRRKFV